MEAARRSVYSVLARLLRAMRWTSMASAAAATTAAVGCVLGTGLDRPGASALREAGAC